MEQVLKSFLNREQRKYGEFIINLCGKKIYIYYSAEGMQRLTFVVCIRESATIGNQEDFLSGVAHSRSCIIK